ncbi:MAG: arginine repressor [Gemmatimonadales bacterium]|jgi:transcriptional regulator of arginine metabolism
MTKRQRHAAILRLIDRHRVANQRQLRTLLQDLGVAVTQATLSRDLHELRIAKVAGPDGTSHYALAGVSTTPTPPLPQLLVTLLIGLDGVGHELVVRTPAGSANALASAIDQAAWSEILGTIAGDDTILIVTRSDRARHAVQRRLENLARTGG